MAETVTDSLAIQIRLDAESVLKTLDVLAEKLNAFTGMKAGPEDLVGKGAGDRAAEEINKATAAAGAAAEAQRAHGKAGEEAGKKVQQGAQKGSAALAALRGMADKALSALKNMVAPLVALTSIKGSFTNFTQEAKALEDAALAARMGVSDIDAWRKANAAAGGSAEAFTQAMVSFCQKTGATGAEFIRMGEQLNGVSDAQANYMLRYMGLSRESAAVFLQTNGQMKELVARYRDMAMTPEDIEHVRKFRIAWTQASMAAKEVGNAFARSVLPIVDRLATAVGKFADFLARHSRVIQIALAAVAAAATAAFGPKAALRMIPTLTSPIGKLVAALALLVLALDDIAGFMNGEDSLFGALLEEAGLSKDEIENLRSALNDAWDALKNLGDQAKEALKPLMQLFAGSVVDGLKLLSAVIGTIAAGLAALFTGDEKAAQAFDSALAALGKTWDTFVENMKERFLTVFTALWEGLAALFTDLIVNPVKKKLNDILPAWLKRFIGMDLSEEEQGQLAAEGRQKLEAAIDEDPFAAEASRAVAPPGFDLAASFTSSLNDLGDAWERWGASLKERVKLFDVGDAFRSALDGLADAWSGWTDGLKERAGKLFDVEGPFKDALAALGDAWSAWVDGLKDRVGKLFDLGDGFRASLDALGEMWDSWTGELRDAFLNTFTSLWETLASLFTDLIVNPVKEKLKGLIPDWGKKLFGIGGEEGDASDAKDSGGLFDRLKNAAKGALGFEAEPAAEKAPVIDLGSFLPETITVHPEYTGTEAVAPMAAKSNAVTNNNQVRAETHITFNGQQDAAAVTAAVERGSGRTFEQLGNGLSAAYSGTMSDF